jgi:hypothetical protein
MSQDCATAVLVLWSSRQFSTADIAALLHQPEAEVSRLIIAARSIVREGRNSDQRAGA